jgi:Zn-dependent protease with chaperone function
MERKKKYAALLICLCAGATGALSSVSAALEPESLAWPVILRSQMARLNDVGYRLGVVAAPLCPATFGGTGISFDYIEAYEPKDRPAISALLHMMNGVQVASVARGSPAELAGIRPGDDLAAIDGESIDALRAASADPSLFADEVDQYLAAKGSGKAVKIALMREGKTFVVQVMPRPICGARFVIKTSAGITAFSDGNNVAVSSKLIGFTRSDDELALIVAHEIGHIINRDGKAGSLNERRRMEDQADLLGVSLIRCAGYDPEKSFQFWQRRDASDWLRMFRDPTHRSRKSRVELMRREASGTSCHAEINFSRKAT